MFSALFFLVVLYFSLRPSGILTWVGKILNPLFLLFLGILLAAALLNPMGDPAALEPIGSYAGQSAAQSFFLGFLEGYNTLDALAALAFGIVLINAIRGLGVQSPQAISASTVKAGCLSTLLMAVIYCLLTVVGAQSRAVYGLSADGGEALYQIGTHYFGTLGGVLLGVTVTFACLKTAIGLITSCASTFTELFPRSLPYKPYAIVFCLFSFGVANFGLNRIIELSTPVLMFLYPLTITMVLLCLAGRWFQYDRRVFVSVIACTALAAFLDFLNALPAGVKDLLHVEALLGPAGELLPFFSIGMGWVVPAAVGLAAGLVLRAAGKKSA